jgi:hypothetical protein
MDNVKVVYSKCVLVALGIHHGVRMRHIVACGLTRSTTVFPHQVKMARFSKLSIEHKIFVLIFSVTSV